MVNGNLKVSTCLPVLYLVVLIHFLTWPLICKVLTEPGSVSVLLPIVLPDPSTLPDADHCQHLFVEEINSVCPLSETDAVIISIFTSIR